MIRSVGRMIRDPRGASAAEFAMVLPILIMFLVGIVDIGRLMWLWNKAEKATQMGVRMAVVTDMVPTGLRDDFTQVYNLVGGDPVPVGTFNSTTCNTTNCTGGWGYDAVAFDRIVQRMNFMNPLITDANVLIRYDNIGLGFAGDPSGPDVSALVTVSVQNVSFRPFLLLGLPIRLPPSSASLTLEDGTGTVSN